MFRLGSSDSHPMPGGTRRGRGELSSIGFTRLIVRNDHIGTLLAEVLIKMADRFTSRLSFFI